MSGSASVVGSASSTPDVTVIVPVYNTMPYLTGCLMSVVEQTIGLDRIEIIAVDDGSTDRSGPELDRFADRYPGVVHVIHQPNSGGPAGPCNRALDVATGRYVFFLGSDDHLGREALQRMVATADALDSDVLAGKVVGVNSRFIYQDIFDANATEVELSDSPLPYSLANTKLFRRELLQRHAIRYLEDLPIGSDLPFTLEACYRARRVTVLADYDFYYAVRRFSATNITYLSRHLTRLRTIESLMSFADVLLPPGPDRDAVFGRLFDHDVTKLIEDDLLGLDRATQQAVHDGVGGLTKRYLSDAIATRLGAETRIRTAVCRDGTLDDVLAVIRQDATVGIPSTVIEGARCYASYPGFRDPQQAHPDAWFDVTTAPDWGAKLDATALSWLTDEAGQRVLEITAHTPVPDLTGLGVEPIAVTAEDVVAATQITNQDTTGTTVRARFRVTDLLAGSDRTGQRRTVWAHAAALNLDRVRGASGLGARGAAAMRAPALRRGTARIRRRGSRLYVITPTRDVSGRLMIAVVPVTGRRIIARVRRLLLPR
jgi:glycosyltransferase involved in cell wall biosynthesis